MQPPPTNFQPQHRPLPNKAGGVNSKPVGMRPPPRPPCKNCGPQMNMQMGNPYGGPAEEVALPTSRQQVGGLGKPLVRPNGSPVPMDQLEQALAEHLAEEHRLNEAPASMNAGVGQKLRESMAKTAGMDEQTAAAIKALFLEMRNLHAEVGALKIALMAPARPVVTEPQLAEYRAMYEQQIDEQMRQMAAQLGREHIDRPKQTTSPAQHDPRTPR
jgi:hypothetical protein